VNASFVVTSAGRESAEPRSSACSRAGSVDTERYAAYLGSMPAQDAVEAEMRLLHPLGRVALTDEVAAAIDYLLSDDAAFVNGTTLPVDGGRSVPARDPEGLWLRQNQERRHVFVSPQRDQVLVKLVSAVRAAQLHATEDFFQGGDLLGRVPAEDGVQFEPLGRSAVGGQFVLDLLVPLPDDAALRALSTQGSDRLRGVHSDPSRSDSDGRTLCRHL
jgi:enoyl-ACP reductase-like protein